MPVTAPYIHLQHYGVVLSSVLGGALAGAAASVFPQRILPALIRLLSFSSSTSASSLAPPATIVSNVEVVMYIASKTTQAMMYWLTRPRCIVVDYTEEQAQPEEGMNNEPMKDEEKEKGTLCATADSAGSPDASSGSTSSSLISSSLTSSSSASLTSSSSSLSSPSPSFSTSSKLSNSRSLLVHVPTPFCVVEVPPLLSCIPHFDTHMFALSTTTLFYASIFEPHHLRPSYWHFVCRVSGGYGNAGVFARISTAFMPVIEEDGFPDPEKFYEWKNKVHARFVGRARALEGS